MGRRGSLWYRDLTCLRSFLSLFKAITSELKTAWDAPHPKAFPFFICVSGSKKKENLPELSCASAQRSGPRAVFSQWINFHVWGDNSGDLRTIFRAMLWTGGVPASSPPWRSDWGVFVYCFHSWAVAGINGLKLPSTFCSNSHVSGFPQLSWNPWFIISFVCEMFF